MLFSLPLTLKFHFLHLPLKCPTKHQISLSMLFICIDFISGILVRYIVIILLFGYSAVDLPVHLFNILTGGWKRNKNESFTKNSKIVKSSVLSITIQEPVLYNLMTSNSPSGPSNGQISSWNFSTL